MFIRLRAIYHRALHAYIVWNNETRRKLAALKRYPTPPSVWATLILAAAIRTREYAE